MDLNVTPENFPALAQQINFGAMDLVRSMGTHAPACQPAPPAIDDISALIPEVLIPWGEGFFGTTQHGAFCQTEASAVMPQVGAAYSGEDILGGADVHTQATMFGP